MKIDEILKILELKKSYGEITWYSIPINTTEYLIKISKQYPPNDIDGVLIGGLFVETFMDINIFNTLTEYEISVVLDKEFPEDIILLNDHLKSEIRNLNINKILK